MARQYRFLVLAFSLVTLSACNILAPFTSNGSDNDLLEEGRHCLHNGDYDCAIKSYEKIADPQLRMQKLCMVQISKSGFTLSNLINSAVSGEQDILGTLAEGQLPYSEAKMTAAEEAKKICLEYAVNDPQGILAVLLRTMALFNHCTIRLAKTDVLQATSDADTACNTPGDGNGQLLATEISDNADGTITSRGMCKADADVCRDDIVLISPAQLTSSGLEDVRKGYDALPAALKDSNSLTAAIRVSLRDTLKKN